MLAILSLGLRCPVLSVNPYTAATSLPVAGAGKLLNSVFVFLTKTGISGSGMLTTLAHPLSTNVANIAITISFIKMQTPLQARQTLLLHHRLNL